ncbi:hemolysin-III related [Stieleria bergensis]|uniref:Hemolysin-III related n=1 Tax=Stieleria bergensis TaxID=2528025 RepID=A0A517SSU9_9BACT|nr:hemolysin-III related [Planctomycetes bacterium SV_7m_r]
MSAHENLTASPQSIADDDSARPLTPLAPPTRSGEEWANALSHGVAAFLALPLAYWLIAMGLQRETTMAVACAVYMLAVFGTFLFSTLSHVIFTQPGHNRMRACDQAMIYAMISGTYTPIVVKYCPANLMLWVLAAMWSYTLWAMINKVFLHGRVNNISPVGYLMLGWLPSLPLYSNVPSGLGLAMLIGGLMYTIGVVILFCDNRARYLHVVWHLMVIVAALTHYMAIMQWVVLA